MKTANRATYALRCFAVALALSLSLSPCLHGQAKEPRRLFDGQSFAGWEGDTQKTFRVQDGAIVAAGDEARVRRRPGVRGAHGGAAGLSRRAFSARCQAASCIVVLPRSASIMLPPTETAADHESSRFRDRRPGRTRGNGPARRVPAAFTAILCCLLVI